MMYSQLQGNLNRKMILRQTPRSENKPEMKITSEFWLL